MEEALQALGYLSWGSGAHQHGREGYIGVGVGVLCVLTHFSHVPEGEASSSLLLVALSFPDLLSP